MINLVIGSFILAAIMGITLLVYVLSNKETPKAVALLHGVFAAVGLVSLIIYALQNTNNFLWIAGLFIIVALVGFYMFARDMTGKSIPKAVALIHGLVAASGLGILFFIVFNKV